MKNRINNKYLEYLRVNAIEASKHNILDNFLSAIINMGILKEFKYYLISHDRNENTIILNKINKLESISNNEIEIVESRIKK